MPSMVQPPHAAQKLRTWFRLKEDFVRGSSTDAVVKVRLFRAADRHYILAVLALAKGLPRAIGVPKEGISCFGKRSRKMPAEQPIILTGAASGIGRAAAEQLAAKSRVLASSTSMPTACIR